MAKNCYLKIISCNIACYSIIVFFVVITVIAGYCCLRMFYPKLDIGSYSELIAALTALFAFIIALLEYKSSKDAKQAQVLSEYNKRYSEDPNITKVVKYLNYKAEGGGINNPIRAVPSNYEVEMFMRFFEEIELQIRYGRLDEEDVLNLFVYYANMLGDTKNKDLRISLGVSEKDYKEHWDGFKSIINKYQLYKNKK